LINDAFQWTTDDDEVALDAITVGIGDDSPAMIEACMRLVEPTANVYWPDWISQGDKIKAFMEGPYSVPRYWSGQMCFAPYGHMSVLLSVYKGARHAAGVG
jgi:hypothetical protein